MSNPGVGVSGDVVTQAQAALALWDKTPGVEINVFTGMVAAEAAYYAAPSLVAELVAEIERLRTHIANLKVGQSNQRILLEQAAVDYSRAIGEPVDGDPQ